MRKRAPAPVATRLGLRPVRPNKTIQTLKRVWIFGKIPPTHLNTTSTRKKVDSSAQAVLQATPTQIRREEAMATWSLLGHCETALRTQMVGRDVKTSCLVARKSAWGQDEHLPTELATIVLDAESGTTASS